MKKICLLFVSTVLLTWHGYAQNLAINTDGSQADANAILDVKSNTKGILIPRMSSAARLAIPPTKGLLVYDSTTQSFWYNTGLEWKSIASSEALSGPGPWLTSGNTGLDSTTAVLGHLDNVPLYFVVNGSRAGRIDGNTGNTYLGFRSNFDNPFAGQENTGIGAGALMHNGNGAFNTALGYQSLANNSNGSENTAVGHRSMLNNTSGRFNTATGFWSLYSNTSGEGNSAIGHRTLYSNTTGQNNTATGFLALTANTSGSQNTAVGHNALALNTDAISNTAVGGMALSNNNANDNTAVGANSMHFNENGFGNAALGAMALYQNINGFMNTAAGFGAMFFNRGGGQNTAIGANALNQNNIGSNIVAVGYRALYANQVGYQNTAVGAETLEINVDGMENTAVGFRALWLNTGSQNTAVGASSEVSGFLTSNATAIGYGAVSNASNKVRIGNSAVTVIEGQVPFTTPSDGRYKFNVEENVKGLDFILQLRPVTYQFDVKKFDQALGNTTGSSYDEAIQMRRSGFIAQEVEQAANATGYNFSGIIKPKSSGEHYSLSYDAFVVPLVKAVQEQQQVIKDQQNKMDQQDKKIATLEQELAEIKKLLQSPPNPLIKPKHQVR